VNNNENQEEAQTLSLTIDQTIQLANPELQLQFNPQTLQVDMLASPSASIDISQISKWQQQIRLEADYDKMLTILVKTISRSKSAFYSFKSLTYNDEPTINPPKTTYTVHWRTNKQGRLKRLTQIYYQKGQGLTSLIYSAAKNKTTLIQFNPKFHTQTFPGMKLLRLNTDQGSLSYSY
jgi:hypothetical protein